MASKPFRIANEVVRAPNGTYAPRYKQPSPPEIVRRSSAEGKSITDLLAEPRNQAMDHPSVGGQPGVGQNPWPPAAKPKQPPMKLNP